MAETVNTPRGPKRSFRRPARIPAIPIVRVATEIAPAIVARDQPKVVINSANSTP